MEHNELEHESHAAQSVEGIPPDLDGAKGSVVPIRLISQHNTWYLWRISTASR